MVTNVRITAGSGTNVSPIDPVLNKITTNDATVNLEPNTFYELGDGALQTLNLPVTDKDGDLIGISSVGSGLFKIVQTASQQILFGTTPTTIGVNGTLEATQINSVIYLRRLAASGLYVASKPQGDFLVDGLTLNNAINNVGGGSSMATLLDTQTFTVGGTWTKPANAAYVNMLIIGGGGGAGAGGRHSGQQRSGGTGGAYAAATYVNNYSADLLGATESVTIGAGGTGAPGQTVDSTDGAGGAVGGTSSFDKFSAHGGDGGDGGIHNDRKTSFSGVLASATMILYNGQQVSSIEAEVQSKPPKAEEALSISESSYENSIGKLCPSSGGPGQCVDSTLGVYLPGVALDYDYISAARVQTAATTAGNPGNDGGTYEGDFGVGASGGAASLTGAGQDGGTGGDNGGGGGGGGTSANGSVSGAGGNGGPGLVKIWTYG